MVTDRGAKRSFPAYESCGTVACLNQPLFSIARPPLSVVDIQLEYLLFSMQNILRIQHSNLTMGNYITIYISGCISAVSRMILGRRLASEGAGIVKGRGSRESVVINFPPLATRSPSPRNRTSPLENQRACLREFTIASAIDAHESGESQVMGCSSSL